jgi:hypothetical protein
LGWKVRKKEEEEWRKTRFVLIRDDGYVGEGLLMCWLTSTLSRMENSGSVGVKEV